GEHGDLHSAECRISAPARPRDEFGSNIRRIRPQLHCAQVRQNSWGRRPAMPVFDGVYIKSDGVKYTIRRKPLSFLGPDIWILEHTDEPLRFILAATGHVVTGDWPRCHLHADFPHSQIRGYLQPAGIWWDNGTTWYLISGHEPVQRTRPAAAPLAGAPAPEPAPPKGAWPEAARLAPPAVAGTSGASRSQEGRPRAAAGTGSGPPALAQVAPTQPAASHAEAGVGQTSPDKSTEPGGAAWPAEGLLNGRNVEPRGPEHLEDQIKLETPSLKYHESLEEQIRATRDGLHKFGGTILFSHILVPCLAHGSRLIYAPDEVALAIADKVYGGAPTAYHGARDWLIDIWKKAPSDHIEGFKKVIQINWPIIVTFMLGMFIFHERGQALKCTMQNTFVGWAELNREMCYLARFFSISALMVVRLIVSNVLPFTSPAFAYLIAKSQDQGEERISEPSTSWRAACQRELLCLFSTWWRAATALGRTFSPRSGPALLRTTCLSRSGCAHSSWSRRSLPQRGWT
ncbi:unnamed protein product, partial [Prorocentrum cordatum]